MIMWGKKMTLIADEGRKDLNKEQKRYNSRRNAHQLKKKYGYWTDDYYIFDLDSDLFEAKAISIIMALLTVYRCENLAKYEDVFKDIIANYFTGRRDLEDEGEQVYHNNMGKFILQYIVGIYDFDKDILVMQHAEIKLTKRKNSGRYLKYLQLPGSWKFRVFMGTSKIENFDIVFMKMILYGISRYKAVSYSHSNVTNEAGICSWNKGIPEITDDRNVVFMRWQGVLDDMITGFEILYRKWNKNLSEEEQRKATVACKSFAKWFSALWI
ncbi:hypothetical protein [Phascolarctobacterium sp.]|uniref:hypothetical protein n=1 Tax=Phascolarctobacterium sp. TaxID=2049039 RepID=UPI003045315E